MIGRKLSVPREDWPGGLPDLFVAGVRLFNAGEFYDCHDALEELWSETLGEERQFLQGLIHAAVALFHFENGNLGGARKMHDSARSYLEPYAPHYWGLDVERLLTELRACFAELLAAAGEFPSGVRLRPDRVPRLHPLRSECRDHSG